jgi:protein-tyrosine phosphatase
MAERGLDLSAHRSKPVDRQVMERADLVLAMTRHHAEALRSEFPDLRDKVWLLSQMDGDRVYDVNDPYGGSLMEYQYCATELENLIDGGLERMRVVLKA